MGGVGVDPVAMYVWRRSGPPILHDITDEANVHQTPLTRSVGARGSRAQRSRAALPILLLMLLMQGCYHFRIDTSAPHATEVHHATKSAFFWGLMQPSAVDDCDDKGVTDVRVSTNLGYQLVAIVTLGIWVPMDVEWRCVKRPPPTPSDQ